jgi:hypothetical protein
MRIIRTFLLLALFVAIIVYFGGNFMARKVVRAGLEYISPQLSARGIDINSLDYEKVRIRSFRSVSVSDITLDFSLDRAMYGKQSFHATFEATRAVIKIVNIKNPSFLLELDDFNLLIESTDSATGGPFGKFEHAYWRAEAPLQLYGIEESGRLVMDRLRKLFKDNSIEDQLYFQGDVILVLDGKSARAHLYTIREDGRTYLRLDRDDILDAASIFEMEMAPATANLIAEYPARAAHLIKITRDATRLSEQMGKDPSFPKDAYKHIYWSYKIAEAFGSEFAEEFTDTHETKPNNTPEERKMDFLNNAVGRSYAEKGIREEEFLKVFLRDRSVIREPSDILRP